MLRVVKMNAEGLPEAGEGAMGRSCSTGVEFRFCKMDRVLEMNVGDSCFAT